MEGNEVLPNFLVSLISRIMGLALNKEKGIDNISGIVSSSLLFGIWQWDGDASEENVCASDPGHGLQLLPASFQLSDPGWSTLPVVQSVWLSDSCTTTAGRKQHVLFRHLYWAPV